VTKQSNRLKIWAALFTAVALTPLLATAQVSLFTVVDLAQRNSSAVKLATADVQKAQAVLAQSKDVFVPSLTFGSGLPAFPSVGFTGGVPSILNASVQGTALSLPQIRYMNAAHSGLKAAMLSQKEAREQVALDASTAYIELDTVNRELEAARQQGKLADRLVEIEQERTEAGVDPLSDLLEAQLTAAQLKLKRLHLETRAGTLAQQLNVLTGLPIGSITPDHASIPEIPAMRSNERRGTTAGIESAQQLARSKQLIAKGDAQYMYFPQISFGAEYLRSTGLLNDANNYYKNDIPANNFSSGYQIQVPLFDLVHRAKARESAADALRATVEVEQAQRQNEVQIAELTGSLRELDTLAEIATLKQQIAAEQIKSVESQLELGNGSGPGATPQLSPKAGQLARIDEQQKNQDAMDASFDLTKARLGLLRALGHMEDWLAELQVK
jgi:outer membrane protein TolC